MVSLSIKTSQYRLGNASSTMSLQQYNQAGTVFGAELLLGMMNSICKHIDLLRQSTDFFCHV